MTLELCTCNMLCFREKKSLESKFLEEGTSQSHGASAASELPVSDSEGNVPSDVPVVRISFTEISAEKK